MSYVDSYLAQVGRHLGTSQRDDILHELRSSIEDQVADIAGDRTPGPDDEKAVLSRLGHPLKVASGYAGPRYLIGPELYPIFLQTLKTILLLIGLTQVAVIVTAYISTGYTTSFTDLFSGIIDTLVWTSIIVVLVFAAIEYSGEQLNWYDNWTPDSLSLADTAPIDRSDLVTNIVSEAVFLLWWNDVLVLQNWWPGAGDTFVVSLAPVWETLFWPLNILFGAWLVLHTVVLLRGTWRPTMLWLELTLGVAGLAVAAWLFRHRPLVNIAGDVSPNAELIVGRVMFGIIVVFAVTIAWDMWLALRRLRESRIR